MKLPKWLVRSNGFARPTDTPPPPERLDEMRAAEKCRLELLGGFEFLGIIDRRLNDARRMRNAAKKTAFQSVIDRENGKIAALVGLRNEIIGANRQQQSKNQSLEK